MRYGNVYNCFKDQYWFWDVATDSRKVLMAAVSVTPLPPPPRISCLQLGHTHRLCEGTGPNPQSTAAATVATRNGTD